MVEPGVRAAALRALQGAARDRLRADEHVLQLEVRGSSPGCRPASRRPAPSSSARAGARQPLQRRLEIRRGAEDADQRLHHRLQVGVQPIRILAGRRGRTAPPAPSAASRSCGRRASGAARLLGGVGGRRGARRAGRRRAGRRASCRPAGWRRACRRPPRRPRTGPGRVLAAVSGVDAHAAHHVVAGRADLHRSGGDVDVGQLLELVVHGRQLAPHAARPAGS